MLKKGAFALALSLVSSGTAAKPALPTALDAGWKGQRVCELLFENAAVRTARCTFPPGVGHERHFHPAHWGYILQGATMRITTADGTVDRDLKAGNSWWSDGIAWHEAVNIGTTTGVYLIVEPKN
jgi:quercetin dioxygenase-like cupin family protein